MKPEKVDKANGSEILHLKEVREPELLCVLHKFFEYHTNPISRSIRRFGNESAGSYLDIQFNLKGMVATVTGSMSKTQQSALSNQVVATLLEKQYEVVGQSIGFSENAPVRGFYRYKDAFQILPIPSEAPHAPMMVAPHPFVLQFKYLSCQDSSINGYRRAEKTAQLTRILNSLCTNAIFAPSRYLRHFWGFSDPNKITLMQPGYGYAGFLPEVAHFSDTSEMSPIKMFPAKDYYHIDFFSGEYDQALPDSIEKYLDKVLALSAADAERFAIASGWFSQIRDLWPVSSSAALIAVVSAIEALLDKKYEICSECKQPKFGVTKSFRDFIRTYVPGIGQQFPEEYKAIYNVRSDLAHGNNLLEGDREYWNYFGKPLEQWQSDFQRNTYHITATALLNWVLTR